MRFAILGGGYGLYGYLPAIASRPGSSVLLPRSIREKLLARVELAPLEPAVSWCATPMDALRKADAIILALPPEAQFDVVSRKLAETSARFLMLEKPLAPAPWQGELLLDQLEKAGIRYEIGLTFPLMEWQRQLDWPRLKSGSAELKVVWQFMAHHFRHELYNWKRRDDMGGGVLRFFGVHIVAMLCDWGYDAVAASSIEPSFPSESERWYARFTGPGLPDCTVHVDSRSKTNLFSVSGGPGSACFHLADPFQLETPTGLHDIRVGLIARLLDRLLDPGQSNPGIYRKTNELWQQSEEFACRAGVPAGRPD